MVQPVVQVRVLYLLLAARAVGGQKARPLVPLQHAKHFSLSSVIKLLSHDQEVSWTLILWNDAACRTCIRPRQSL